MGYFLRLYFRLLGAQLRSEMQYRTSFMAELFGSFLITGLDFVAIAILLTRFQAIGGWTLTEVALLYGASAISLSLAELFVGAFDDFDKWVVRGEFDRVLIRPLGVVFQMLAGALPLRRLGRMSQGLIVLIYALSTLRPAWGAGQWLYLAVMLAGGALFFMAIFITGATMAFWTPQTAELTNIFTYGGQFMTSYPMHIYEEWMRAVFTFVIPMAFINYYPALYLLGKPDPFGLPAWLPFLAPVVAVIAFAAAIMFWRVGVRRYQSTGS
jgi:ABC-2 type transport system permease protein